MDETKPETRTMVEVDKETRRLLRVAAAKRDIPMKELLRRVALRIEDFSLDAE